MLCSRRCSFDIFRWLRISLANDTAGTCIWHAHLGTCVAGRAWADHAKQQLPICGAMWHGLTHHSIHAHSTATSRAVAFTNWPVCRRVPILSLLRNFVILPELTVSIIELEPPSHWRYEDSYTSSLPTGNIPRAAPAHAHPQTNHTSTQSDI